MKTLLLHNDAKAFKHVVTVIARSKVLELAVADGSCLPQVGEQVRCLHPAPVLRLEQSEEAGYVFIR